jgi:prevent-host-death family protein
MAANQLSVREVRDHLSDVLQAVEQGRETEITRYGRPVARIVPIAKDRPAFPDLSAFHQSLGLDPDEATTLTDVLLELRQEERF